MALTVPFYAGHGRIKIVQAFMMRVRNLLASKEGDAYIKETYTDYRPEPLEGEKHSLRSLKGQGPDPNAIQL